MLIYGSSKYLEDNTLDAVCRLIRDVKGRPCEEDELLDEILGEYQIVVHDRRLISVENKTSYMRCSEADTAYFYLGGYANRFQRDFLKKVYEDNPGLEYLHFGDIDAGGFYIHENLCRITGIPFRLYRMSVEELRDLRFQTCLLTLSGNDRRRLKALRECRLYRDVVQYMLEHDVKLEQEIVSYYS